MPTLPLVLLAALAVKGTNAAVGGRRGPAVEIDASSVVHIAGVLLLPCWCLPFLALPTLLARKGALWHQWNVSAHVACLGATAFVYWSIMRVPSPSTGLSLAVAGVGAALAYWFVELTSFTWIEHVTLHQTPAETGMWAPSAVALDISLACAGALIGAAVVLDAWMTLLALPVLTLVLLGIAAMDRAGAVSFDAKTGLLTLPAFQQWGTRDLAAARRRGEPVAVVMIDLDHFRAVNTAHGHLMGDVALCHAAALVDAGHRVTDLAGRYGGEEFVLLLVGSDLGQSVQVAERLRRAIEAGPVPGTDRPVRLTASLGVAAWDGAESIDDLIRRADQALYAAKNSGRNCVRVAPGA
jgi:diguanylate cyclase (GGDEF)-like protein